MQWFKCKLKNAKCKITKQALKCSNNKNRDIFILIQLFYVFEELRVRFLDLEKVIEIKKLILFYKYTFF